MSRQVVLGRATIHNQTQRGFTDPIKNEGVEMGDFKKLYSAKLVANFLGISEGSVWRLSALGTIPAPIKISPGVTRWEFSEISQFLESKKAARFEAVALTAAAVPTPRRNPVPPSTRSDAKRPGRPRKCQDAALGVAK